MIHPKSALGKTWRNLRKIEARGALRFLDFRTIFINSHGDKFLIQRRNSLDHLIASSGSIDNDLPYKILGLCNPDSVAIDIGANAGYYTVPLARFFLQVHAFEPVPSIAKKLLDNVLINNLNNVLIHTAAVGEFDEFATLFLQDSVDGDYKINSGLSSLIERPFYSKGSIKVPVHKVDSLRLETKVGMIKIDVEGSESSVLRGALDVIKQSSPIIVWEASFSISRSNVESCISLLNSLDYTSFLLDGNLNTVILTSSNFKDFHVDCNILSIPRGINETHEVQSILSK